MICENTFPAVIGYDCLNACILSYLRFQGLKVSPYDVFFIGKGFDIKYNHNNFALIKSEAYKANFTFLKFINVDYTNICLDLVDETLKLDFLVNKIKSNEMISLKVASNLLNYHVSFRQVQPMIHYINIIGYDEHERLFYVSDSFVPTHEKSLFQGWVDADVLMKAWTNLNCEYFEIYYSKHISKVDYSTESLQCMLDSVRDYIESKTIEKDCSICGQSAILQLCKDLKKDIDKTELVPYAKDINYKLKVFGFISSKEYLLTKLRTIQLSEEIIKDYAVIVSKWDKLGTSLVRNAITKKNGLFDIFTEGVYELVRKENEILVKILNDC